MSRLVFKVLPPSATFHGIDYSERKCKKNSANLLHYENFGLLQSRSQAPSKNEMKNYMDMICSCNKRIRNKQFHAILSCKEKIYSLEQLKSYALEILNRLGYRDNPVAIYGHNDTQHHHVHIITTRIGIDGKKIPHHFEGKRSNEILSQILLTDKKQLFETALTHSLNYSFSSSAQFRLLMELKGYRVKTAGDHLEFFKFGSRQATIPIHLINSKIKTTVPANIQMRAVIRKYKNPLNIKPILPSKEKYSTAKKAYRTTLTEDLYKKFGWQFVFFSNPKHDQPYGFVIIDHQKNIVHKGSNIIALHELLSPDEKIPKTTTSVSQEDALTIQLKPEISIQELEETIPFKKAEAASPLAEIDKIIGQTAFDAEQELYKAHDPKRKKGRYL